MTQLQTLQLQRLKNNPAAQLLISKLDLIPSNTELKYSQQVSNRVSEIIASFESKPVVQRSTPQTAEDSFFNPDRIERHLIAFYGPRPWKYPLTKTPF
jgi:hypothetical protein